MAAAIAGKTNVSCAASCSKSGSDLQICNIKINKFRRNIVVQRVLHINLVHQIPVLIRDDLAGISIFDQRLEVEWIHRTEFIYTADDNNRGLVHLAARAMTRVPAAATSPPLARTECVPRITLLTRDMRAKTAESGIRMTVIPRAISGFWNESVLRISSSVEAAPLTVVCVASWLLG